MGRALVVLVCVAVAGCGGVHVDEVNINDPNVNIGQGADVDLNTDVDVDAEANLDADVNGSADVVQPPAEKPAPQVDSKVAPVRQAEPDAVEPEPEPLPPPCDDSDADGVCNDADVCPAGADTDADANGYADACEQELWSVGMLLREPISFFTRYVDEDQPGLAVIEAWGGSLNCYIDGVGSAFVGLPIKTLGAHETTTVILPRPTTQRAAKLVECLEAGMQLHAFGATTSSRDGYTGTESWSDYVTEPQKVPTLAGKRLVYFKVYATAYWHTEASPYGTTVHAFHAVVSAHGYGF